MTNEELDEAIAKACDWYQLNGAWMHPKGYAKNLPRFVEFMGRENAEKVLAALSR